MGRYDAVLIPGGGVRAGGMLPAWVAARMDRALAVEGLPWLVPLSGGTAHRPPPLDEHGFPWTESRAGARYLVEHGAEAGRVLMEEVSYDTIGNAYFSRVIHAIPRGFRRGLVITSEFHLARTRAIFEWVYGLDGPGERCALEFAGVADDGIDAAALAARTEKERAALGALEKTRARIATLGELHRWLFTAHEAYAWTGGRRAPSADAALY